MSDFKLLSQLSASLDPKTFLSYLMGSLRWREKSIEEGAIPHKFSLEDVAYDFLTRYHKEKLEEWEEKNNPD